MSNSRNQNGRSLPPFGNFISYIHSRKHEVYAPATSLGPGYNSPKVMPEFEGFISYLHTRKHEVAAPKSEKHEVAVPKSEKHEVAAPKPEKHEVATPKPTYCVHSSSYDHLSPDIPVGYEEDFSGEIQEGKKRRRIEKKGVSEGRKSEERGRKIFKEETGVFRSQHERPLTMELGGLTSWGNADKTIFNDLMTEFRRGELDSAFPDSIFGNGRVDYWKTEFWITLATLYNNKASDAGLAPRQPYELVLQGEKIEGAFTKQRCHGSIKEAFDQIFSPCTDCQRIPIFPVSLQDKLGYLQRLDPGSRSRSRSTSISESRARSEAGFASAGSGVGTGSGYYVTADILSAETGQVVSMFWAMLMKELISDDDMSALLHRADKWFKDRGAWWTFVLDTNVPLERKANILKLDLRST